MRGLTGFGWLAAAFLAAAAGAMAQSPVEQARTALHAGEVDRALSTLDGILGQNHGDAEAHNLKCRALALLDKWDAAADECEQAVKLNGQSSEYHLWLGRTVGERASRASFVSAYGLGKRSRVEFETAAKLDPHNGDALADLGEFYYSAPSVVGGGMDKAESVALQLDRFDQARAHELRGHAADHRGDAETAEKEFKVALGASQHPAFQWMTLASFYRRHQRWEEMEQAIRSGQTAAAKDAHGPVALYLGASILRATKRDPGLEEKLLEGYLAGRVKTEEAPAFVAHLWLAELKAQAGDGAGAEKERQASLAMAHEYRAAVEFRGARH